MDLSKNPSKLLWCITEWWNIKLFANHMLEVFSQTTQDLSRKDDDNYTISCAIFGRCRNRFAREIRSGNAPSPTYLEDSSNKFTFKIGNTPGIRF